MRLLVTLVALEVGEAKEVPSHSEDYCFSENFRMEGYYFFEEHSVAHWVVVGLGVHIARCRILAAEVKEVTEARYLSRDQKQGMCVDCL